MVVLDGYEIESSVYKSERSLIYRGKRLADRQAVIVKTAADRSAPSRENKRLRHEHEIGCRVLGAGAVVNLGFLVEPITSSLVRLWEADTIMVRVLEAVHRRLL